MRNENAIDIRPYQRAKRYVMAGSAIAAFLLKLKEARVRRQTIRELQGLTDAQLNDIGIPRYDIRRVVNAKLAQKAPVGQLMSGRRDSRSNDAQTRPAMETENKIAA